jgi:hypothetical protein
MLLLRVLLFLGQGIRRWHQVSENSFKKISDQQPEPHAKYVVARDGCFFTATPCYGLHKPWWVVRTMGIHNEEADPVEFREDDEWVPLADFSPAALIGELQAYRILDAAGRVSRITST